MGSAARALAQVLQRFGPAYLRDHALSVAQARAWRAILACRTAALGGVHQRCDACGHVQALYHSCRNRHCPQCQTRAKEQWLAARTRETLPVPYAHLVFTLPHTLNALAGAHPRWVYEMALANTAATLGAFAADAHWLGAQCAITLVLHTWTQDLRRHVHVHALVSMGGLDAQGHWVTPPRRGFLFPVRALSRVFRGKCLAALAQAEASGQLPGDPATTPAARAARRSTLYAHDWVVYAKTALHGAPAVLGYLARYTHRTALSNERILGIDAEQVRLRVRDNASAGPRKKTLVLVGVTLIARFLQHVLPPGFKRIRHYGLLAPAGKARRLAAARAALDQPTPPPALVESLEDFLRRVGRLQALCCPRCAVGLLRCLAPIARVPSPAWPHAPPPWHGRAPP